MSALDKQTAAEVAATIADARANGDTRLDAYDVQADPDRRFYPHTMLFPAGTRLPAPLVDLENYKRPCLSGREDRDWHEARR